MQFNIILELCNFKAKILNHKNHNNNQMNNKSNKNKKVKQKIVFNNKLIYIF